MQRSVQLAGSEVGLAPGSQPPHWQALRSEIGDLKFQKRPVKTEKLNQIKPSKGGAIFRHRSILAPRQDAVAVVCAGGFRGCLPQKRDQSPANFWHRFAVAGGARARVEKTKPKCEAARAIGGRAESENSLFLQEVAGFAGSVSPADGQGEITERSHFIFDMRLTVLAYGHRARQANPTESKQIQPKKYEKKRLGRGGRYRTNCLYLLF